VGFHLQDAKTDGSPSEAGIPRAKTGTLSPVQTSLAWTMGALFILNTMNYVDRLLFSVAQELIKTDLGLSDFQLGLLGGPAFALLYVLSSFPIARLAERHHRVSIISLSFAAWSAMTAFCGVASNFFQLLIGRGGVSIGEAGCTPSAHSLISDYFPPARRTSAMSLFAAAGPLGALLAAIGGGWMVAHFGWRAAFIGCGAFGLIAALVFRFTVREPARSGEAKAIKPLLATLGRRCGRFRKLLEPPIYDLVLDAITSSPSGNRLDDPWIGDRRGRRLHDIVGRAVDRSRPRALSEDSDLVAVRRADLVRRVLHHCVSSSCGRAVYCATAARILGATFLYAGDVCGGAGCRRAADASYSVRLDDRDHVRCRIWARAAPGRLYERHIRPNRDGDQRRHAGNVC
jgi:hypothetical protein